MTTLPAPPPLTVKLLALVPVPAAVVTLIVPVVAAEGTVVEIDVSELTVKFAPAPLNATVVAPVKFAPEIVTLVPAAPLVGEKLVMLGAGVPPFTVKLVALVATPPPVVTVICPVLLPVATVALICVSELTVNDAASVPLNRTNEAPVNPVPLIVTLCPTGPLVGEKLVMVGVGGALPPASFFARKVAANVGSSAVKNV
jgi:hypothetical protein